jgi:predicted nucleic acid-binding protein
MLSSLVRLPGFRVQTRRADLRALHLFGTTPGLDFGDAMIAVQMEQQKQSSLYSYDRDFPWVTRQEP